MVCDARIMPEQPIPDWNEVIHQLIEWYWGFGVRRDRKYQLGSGGWLYRAYRARDSANRVQNGGGRSRATFGLWGPSQVGKSTLLSVYLDRGADPAGNGSILQWHPDQPVRFEKHNAAGDSVTLNPYNFRSDASACITRFCLSQHVRDRMHPVEIKMATESQILHSLTLGFALDWHVQRRERLTNETYSELLDATGRGARLPKRAAFERLVPAAALLDLLVSSRFPDNPFEALAERSASMMLESPAVQSTDAGIDALFAKLFWGNQGAITELHQSLRDFRTKLSPPGKHARSIFCSYDAASILLDMATYVKAVGGVDLSGDRVEPDQKIRNRILQIRMQESDDYIALDLHEGSQIFHNPREFALLQGLVWELTIPVNAARLVELKEEGQVLKDLLSATDILDFPGISNVGTGGSDSLDDEKLSDGGDHLLFSHLLKRGKTNAMVAASSEHGYVDGFCVLLRALGPIARPGLIADGIQTWWKSKTGTDLTNRSRPTTLNVCLTFFGELLSDVLRNPDKNIGPAFEKFRSLGVIASPEISTFFPIVLPKYERISKYGDDKPTDAELDAAVTRLSSDEQAGEIFANRSFVKKAALGEGIDLLCKNLQAQAEEVLQSQPAVKRQEQLADQGRALINEALPGGSTERELRDQTITGWHIRLTDRIGLPDNFKRSECEVLSSALRALLTVRPEDLEPIPLNLVELGRSPQDYLSAQLTRWREKDTGNVSPAAVGLGDRAEMARVLTYFSESLNMQDSAAWLEENFGRLTEAWTARDARRYVAVHLTGKLIRGSKNPVRVETIGTDRKTAIEQLVEFANGENPMAPPRPQFCSHYASVIGPFLDRLAELRKTQVSTRPNQPGDIELLALSSNWPMKQ
ncbi:MAG TPA: virulence factor SrfC family protein [Chthoniobacterales bacterium]|jgi:hypothetical protein|nr:virulence factor SrfC family protein [Chthoniobacterales bacterium]